MEPSGAATRAFVVVARSAIPEHVRSRVLEGAPDAIVVVASDDRIMLVNDRVEALFGYGPEELLGRPVEVLVPGRFAERHATQVRSYVADPHVRPMHAFGQDVFGRRKNGTEFQAEALRFRDDFVVLVSHELKTPLTAARLSMDRFGRSLAAGASRTDIDAQFQRVDHALRRMEHLVEDLLDVSHLIAGDFVLAREEPFDLCELVSGEVERARDLLERAGCAISVSLSGPLMGQWDRSRLRQVFSHLLSNAAKYGAGKPIEVTALGHGGEAIVTVHDEGAGRDARERGEALRALCTLRVLAALRGLGLGLWIVREVVEAHGGHAEIVRDGRPGTTFRMRLPLGRV